MAASKLEELPDSQITPEILVEVARVVGREKIRVRADRFNNMIRRISEVKDHKKFV